MPPTALLAVPFQQQRYLRSRKSEGGGDGLDLGDLGLGRYLDLQSILAFSQVGTPLYLSPEIVKK